MTDTSDLATRIAPGADPNAGAAATADHELVAIVCRLVGDVDAHAARLARVEERADAVGAFVDQFEETFAGGGAETFASGGTETFASGGTETFGGVDADPGADGADLTPSATGAAAASGPPAAASDEEKPAGLDMRELVAWVGDNVAALLERKIPQTGGAPYWCRRWWLHPEAIARFEAARRCWVEAVTGEGAAMVVYFEHLDAMIATLCGENGPFCGCVGGQHNDTDISTALGQDDPGEAYYRRVETSDGP